VLSDRWQTVIASAGTAKEVVAAAREFLSTWTEAQIAALPEDCRPGEMNNADDVAGYAFTLVQEQCIGEDQPPALNAMASFFASASTRLSEIVAPKDYALRRPLKT
jgi:hypothetical protein